MAKCREQCPFHTDWHHIFALIESTLCSAPTWTSVHKTFQNSWRPRLLCCAWLKYAMGEREGLGASIPWHMPRISADILGP